MFGHTYNTDELPCSLFLAPTVVPITCSALQILPKKISLTQALVFSRKNVTALATFVTFARTFYVAAFIVTVGITC